MKKLLAILLCLVLVFVLAACGEDPEPTNPTNVPTDAPTDDPADAPTDAPHTHSYGDWAVIAEPDCEKEGAKERTCACGEKENEAIPAKGHDWLVATCAQAKHCLVCDAQEGEPLPHNFANATCVDPKTCFDCGATEGEALGHVWNEATCELAKQCNNCGQMEGEALGHSYENGTCIRCDAVDPVVQRLEEGKWMSYSPSDFDIYWERLTFSDGKVFLCGDEGTNILQFTPEIQEQIKEYQPARIIEYNGGLYVMPVATWTESGKYTVEGDLITVVITGPEGEISRQMKLRLVDDNTLEIVGSNTRYSYETNEHKHFFFEEGSCTAPWQCSCGEIKGDIKDHTFDNGFCTVCGEADPARRPKIDGSWTATTVHPDGEMITTSLYCGTDTWSYGVGFAQNVKYLTEQEIKDYQDCFSSGGELFEYNGETYCPLPKGDGGKMAAFVNGDMIDVYFWDSLELHLKQTNENTLVEVDTSGNPIPDGRVFIKDAN